MAMLRSTVQQGGRLLEDPWITQCPAGNHHTSTTRFRQHAHGVLWCKDVAVAYHRDLHRVRHLTDNLPICLAGIELGAGATVHRHRLGTSG